MNNIIYKHKSLRKILANTMHVGVRREILGAAEKSMTRTERVRRTRKPNGEPKEKQREREKCDFRLVRNFRGPTVTSSGSGEDGCPFCYTHSRCTTLMQDRSRYGSGRRAPLAEPFEYLQSAQGGPGG